jgi:hypothetical protein
MLTTSGAELISEARRLQESARWLIIESRQQQTLLRLMLTKSREYREHIRAGNSPRIHIHSGLDSIWYLR